MKHKECFRLWVIYRIFSRKKFKTAIIKSSKTRCGVSYYLTGRHKKNQGRENHSNAAYNGRLVIRVRVIPYVTRSDDAINLIVSHRFKQTRNPSRVMLPISIHLYGNIIPILHRIFEPRLNGPGLSGSCRELGIYGGRSE